MTQSLNSFTMHSPFQLDARLASQPDAAGATGVHLHAHTLASVTLISTWLAGAQALEQALSQALGPAVPSQTGQVATSNRGVLMRTGPSEFLLIGHSAESPLAQLRQAVAPEIGSVTDLSHARCCIRVEGAQCQTTLNKLFALDFRESEFPIGEIRLTGTHHVPSLLHRQASQCFDLYVMTGYAQDQFDALQDAAREYGVLSQVRSA